MNDPASHLVLLRVDEARELSERVLRANGYDAEEASIVDSVLDDVSSGGACVNQTLMHLIPADLPFGGVGDSGMGSYHGKAGFDALSHRKSVLRKSTKLDLRMLYPPYKGLTEKLVKRLIR